MVVPSSATFLVRFPREVRAIVCSVDAGCRCRNITVRSADAKYYVPVGKNNLSRMEVWKVELELFEMEEGGMKLEEGLMLERGGTWFLRGARPKVVYRVVGPRVSRRTRPSPSTGSQRVSVN